MHSIWKCICACSLGRQIFIFGLHSNTICIKNKSEVYWHLCLNGQHQMHSWFLVCVLLLCRYIFYHRDHFFRALIFLLLTPPPTSQYYFASKQVSKYTIELNCIQFALDKPLPYKSLVLTQTRSGCNATSQKNDDIAVHMLTEDGLRICLRTWAYLLIFI